MSLACAAAFGLPCLAQVSPTFRFQNSPSAPTPASILAMDFNKDGIPDIVQTGDTGFAISLARGDGTFFPPVQYSFQASGPSPMAAGDFNGDGNADLMFTDPGTAQLVFYAGDGKGAFQTPRYVQVELAPTEVFSSAVPVLAADFNHDGKLDLLVGAAGPPFTPTYPCYCVGPQDLYVLEGDGTGGFSEAASVYTLAANTQIGSYAIGDFDGDNNADIALTTNPAQNPFAPGGPSFLSVLFGTGTLSFEEHPLFADDTASLNAPLGAGDVNSDGRSDIYFVEGASDQLWVYMGNPDRTFTLARSDMPSLDELQYDALIPGSFALADLNSDGRMDLVTYAYNIINAGLDEITSNLIVMVASGAPGMFKYQVVPLPANYDQNSQAVVGDFNGNLRPDVVVGLYAFGKPSTLVISTNTTWGGLWSDCGYPMGGEHIVVCSPVDYSDGKVSFNAAASSFGTLRKMELWVDGTKMAEQYHAWENHAWLTFKASLNPGMHHATIYAGDIDHTLHNTDFSFSIGNDTCAPPDDPGVNVCKHWNGSFPGSPTTVQATARITGTLARMEIWVDGVKKFTQTTSTLLNAAVPVLPGPHQFDVYAVNTSGTAWRTTVTTTAE